MALYNLARMSTATTGTGTITLATAVSGYLSFANAGVPNGAVVSYGIADGANCEVGVGTYSSSGPTLTRGPIGSSNSNAAISLSGNAQVFITALAGVDFGTGCVRMVAPSLSTNNSTPWYVFDPYGNPVSTSGTTTQGLQEAINYAVNNGWPLIVDGVGQWQVSTYPNPNPGNGSLLNAASTITCTSGISIPRSQIAFIEMRNVSIWFTSAVSAGDGITIDSAEMTRIWIHGQVVFNGSSGYYAVRVKPSSGTPYDNNVAFDPSELFIHTIVCQPGASASGCICFDLSEGSISSSKFRFVEVNGGAFGIAVYNPQSGTLFEQNIIEATNIHASSSAGIQEGFSTTYAGNIRQNIWTISGIRPNGSSSSGFNSFGSYDIVNIGGITNEEGTLYQGINLQSSTTHMKVTYGQIVGAGTAVVNSGTSNTIVY